MNLSLAFLHGEQALVGFILAAVIVLLGFPLLVYVWLRHTKLSEKKLALAYFIVTAGACVMLGLGVSHSEYIPTLTVFYIAFIYTLPWNVITMVASHFFGYQYMCGNEVVLVMLMGAGSNAMLLYHFARKMRGSV